MACGGKKSSTKKSTGTKKSGCKKTKKGCK